MQNGAVEAGSGQVVTPASISDSSKAATDSALPAASVILRSCDRPLLLRRALQSLREQTRQDFEILLINEAGTLDIAPLLAPFVADFGARLRRIDNPVARGRGGALTQGVELARGMAIAVLDDDDSWAPTFLACMLGRLEAAPACAAVACQATLVFETVAGGMIQRHGEQAYGPGGSSLSLFGLMAANQIPINCLVYRRAEGIAAGLYPAEGAVLEDWQFLLRLASRVEIVLLPQALAFYHKRLAADDPRLGNTEPLTGVGEDYGSAYVQLFNSWLRTDLQAGQVGLGVVANIANMLARIEARLMALESRLPPPPQM